VGKGAMPLVNRAREETKGIIPRYDTFYIKKDLKLFEKLV